MKALLVVLRMKAGAYGTLLAIEKAAISKTVFHAIPPRIAFRRAKGLPRSGAQQTPPKNRPDTLQMHKIDTTGKRS
ncbi:hypothetical protein ERN12_15650 [Rhodobacteraceae bacterium]|nr:hypothetical protein ERN12_15650 [Paracoccaceae bacterium]